MNKLKTFTILASGLAILMLISMFFSSLALTDIAKNIEPNLNAEWNIVRIGFLIQFLLAMTVFVIYYQLRIF